jgi:Arc/MetJ-type ribon-helix-helix transcriptional regulator
VVHAVMGPQARHSSGHGSTDPEDECSHDVSWPIGDVERPWYDGVEGGLFDVTIHLSKDLERFVQDAVRTGRYATEDDVIRDALLLLRRDMPTNAGVPGRRTKRVQPDEPNKPLTPDELNQQMLASGLIARLPDPAEDIDDAADPPIAIKGEPLSETIIRERR